MFPEGAFSAAWAPPDCCAWADCCADLFLLFFCDFLVDFVEASPGGIFLSPPLPSPPFEEVAAASASSWAKSSASAAAARWAARAAARSRCEVARFETSRQSLRAGRVGEKSVRTTGGAPADCTRTVSAMSMETFLRSRMAPLALRRSAASRGTPWRPMATLKIIRASKVRELERVRTRSSSRKSRPNAKPKLCRGRNLARWEASVVSRYSWAADATAERGACSRMASTQAEWTPRRAE
mmetsp:Transcript_10594/g.35029  ORF Transcript_10594/g.35029 Transcript_10594/m.35029 type:complete len:239 (-) Transcript_10594:601-1317(-)